MKLFDLHLYLTGHISLLTRTQPRIHEQFYIVRLEEELTSTQPLGIPEKEWKNVDETVKKLLESVPGHVRL